MASPVSYAATMPRALRAGERLAQRYNEAQTLKVTKSEVQKRIEKRKAYMEEVSQVSYGLGFAIPLL